MATVANALCDLPAPPYSHPSAYATLVEAMVQELYRLNPEWVERKRQLQQVCVFLVIPHKECIYLSSFVV
jgi:hypothetical protein